MGLLVAVGFFYSFIVQVFGIRFFSLFSITCEHGLVIAYLLHMAFILGSIMKSIRQTLVGVACAGMVSLASAATVKVTFDNPIWSLGPTGYDMVSLTYLTNKSNDSTAPDFTKSATTTINNVGAGEFEGTGSELKEIAASVFVDGLNDLYMYCYDIYQHIGYGSVVTYDVDMNGETDRTRDFLGAVNFVLNDRKGYAIGQTGYDKFAWLHPADNYQSAAIQLGIWESLYDTGDNWTLSNGYFSASGIDSGTDTNLKTQQYLNKFFTAINASQSVADIDVMVLRSSTNQDMITGDPVPVPEPGTLALLGAALMGWGLSRRNKAIKKD